MLLRAHQRSPGGSPRSFLVAATLAVLAGCASVPYGARRSPPNGYEPESGRDATAVAEMRAAPAPATPAVEQGGSPAADRARLLAQRQVVIGHAYFPGEESAARNAAVDQGRRVGADRILLYPPSAPANAAAMPDSHDGAWQAMFYVRFQLPFGASFRDLGGAEKQKFDHGVRIGSVVAGTPASRANLLSGDVVVALDGKAIENRSQFRAVLHAKAGHTVTLAIVRNGETLDRPVRLGILADAEER